MSLSYRIEYQDKHGIHFAFKRGDGPDDALAALKRSHKKSGCAISYSAPVPDSPQPFSDESRAFRAEFWRSHDAPAKAPEVVVDMNETTNDEPAPSVEEGRD